MGSLTMILAALGSFAGVIVLGLLKDEAAAWLPRLTTRIIKFAASRMPSEMSMRYEEEWASHVNDYPGKISQLYQAINLLRAAESLRPKSRLYIVTRRALIVIGSCYYIQILVVFRVYHLSITAPESNAIGYVIATILTAIVATLAAAMLWRERRKAKVRAAD